MQHKIFPIVSLLCINGYIVFLVYILDSSSQPVSGREPCQVKYENMSSRCRTSSLSLTDKTRNCRKFHCRMDPAGSHCKMIRMAGRAQMAVTHAQLNLVHSPRFSWIAPRKRDLWVKSESESVLVTADTLFLRMFMNRCTSTHAHNQTGARNYFSAYFCGFGF